MKNRLSGLMDGEIEAQEAAAALDAVKGDAELRDRWRHYQVIGDALKGERALDRDITPRVMAALRDEPVVMAPRRREHGGWPRVLLAMAATVAGVAFVGWVALGPQTGQRLNEQVAAAPASPAKAGDPATAPDMHEYLVAHQAQAGSLQLRGGTENIRTVAVSGAAAR